MMTPYFSSYSIFNRGLSVVTPIKKFNEIDLGLRKVVAITPTHFKTPFPAELDWEIRNPIRIFKTTSSSAECNQAKSHYYFGGLPALMQAARKLKTSNDPVVYVNDGQAPKTLQSGHQAHVHPSEWSAKESSISSLFKAAFRGMGLMVELNPTDPEYSHLHFSLKMRDVAKDPLSHLNIFTQFFMKAMVHNLTSIDRVSKEDHWICKQIVESLDFHQELSAEIEKETGIDTLKRGSRLYWSPSLAGIQRKREVWKSLGISSVFMTKEEVKKYTLLKLDANLFVSRIEGDGKFRPEAPTLILNHLLKKFPDRFVTRNATVHSIYTDSCGTPMEVHENFGGVNHVTHVQSMIGSPGHNDVFLDSSNKKLWQEVPVSGISAVWLCRISTNELRERFDFQDRSDEELNQYVQNLVAAANLHTLHVTICESYVEDHQVVIMIRTTQGANFNSTTASKYDLLNMRYNLDQYYIGKWELLSVGTCTRKTWVSNVPEFYEISKNSGFVHGLSGLGYSFSGADFEACFPKRYK